MTLALDGEFPQLPGQREEWLEWPEVGPPRRWMVSWNQHGEWYVKDHEGRYWSVMELACRWGALVVYDLADNVESAHRRWCNDCYADRQEGIA